MSEPVKHLIFDFETCGNRPTSVVPSVALLIFDPSIDKSFDELVSDCLRIKFHIEPQFADRTYDQDVIDFWTNPKQAEAKKMVIDVDGSEVDLSEMQRLVEEYFKANGWDPTEQGAIVWTRGNEFDPPILNDICRQFGWDKFYPFWAVRDVRTYIDSLLQFTDDNYVWWGNPGKDFCIPSSFVKHREEHDVAVDVLKMQFASMKMLDLINKTA